MGILDFFFLSLNVTFPILENCICSRAPDQLSIFKKTCWQSSVILHGGDLKLEEPFIHFI